MKLYQNKITYTLVLKMFIFFINNLKLAKIINNYRSAVNEMSKDDRI